MTAEIFAQQLDELMARALEGNNAPVARMVYELEMAKNRMVRIQLMIEQQHDIAAATKAIIPANGHLKVVPPPSAGGR